MIITLIADNYYGYCKKEVKTQISFAANLLGNVEEEHSGGAMAFASYSLGYAFDATRFRGNGRTINDVVRDDPEVVELQPEGLCRSTGSTRTSFIFPETARASIARLQVWWTLRRTRVCHPPVPRPGLHDPLGVQATARETSREQQAGGLLAPWPRGSSATSRARSAAEERARSPRACVTT